MRGIIQRTAPRFEPRRTSSAIECDADPGQSLEEIKFVEEQAQRDPRVHAIVAHAPLERGGAVEPLLEESVRCSSKLRGIRRILQSETNWAPCCRIRDSSKVCACCASRPALEITVTHRQMDCVVEFVRSLPEIPMVLDHCGKPGIRHGLLDAFRHCVGELSRLPNIHCKLSGLATEAEHGRWTDAQLFPYIDTALQAFGPDGLLYGSESPYASGNFAPGWISVLERALVGCSINRSCVRSSRQRQCTLPPRAPRRLARVDSSPTESWSCGFTHPSSHIEIDIRQVDFGIGQARRDSAPCAPTREPTTKVHFQFRGGSSMSRKLRRRLEDDIRALIRRRADNSIVALSAGALGALALSGPIFAADATPTNSDTPADEQLRRSRRHGHSCILAEEPRYQDAVSWRSGRHLGGGYWRLSGRKPRRGHATYSGRNGHAHVDGRSRGT